MNIRIGHWPLAAKLWGAFAALTLFIFTLLAVLLPWTLKGFFTEQLYDILLDTQSGLQVSSSDQATMTMRIIKPISVMSSDQAVKSEPIPIKALISNEEAAAGIMRTTQSPSLSDETPITTYMAAPTLPRFIGIGPMEGPAIQHFMITGTEHSATTVAASMIGKPFIQAMEQDAFSQSATLGKYTKVIDNKSMFYVIRKEQVEGRPSFMVSYASSNYRNDLVMTMFYRLMLLMVILILSSWLPCFAIARHFTRPLVQMERHVGMLSERNWHEPLVTSRKDEMGRLAKAIETMRQRLVRQDRSQQFFLQHTSHELKTPVMVIRSYAQSIHDGIFPKGSLKESVDVIMKESERLEQRIHNLLLLNKLNYLTSREKPFLPFDLNEVILDAVERLRFRRPDIRWEMNLDPVVEIKGDPEQWKVALENLFDNQLRYAKTYIQIEVGPAYANTKEKNEAKLPVIRISNDGPPLENTIAESLFEPFRSGGDGQFGLGLAIVRQIIHHHGMHIRAENESPGVAFYIEPEKHIS